MTTDKRVEEWRESNDFKQAVYAADKLLGEPYADPDDHARTVARQFNRMIERYDTLTQHHQDLMSEEREKISNDLRTILMANMKGGINTNHIEAIKYLRALLEAQTIIKPK